jgi:hypothetical protein
MSAVEGFSLFPKEKGHVRNENEIKDLHSPIPADGFARITFKIEWASRLRSSVRMAQGKQLRQASEWIVATHARSVLIGDWDTTIFGRKLVSRWCIPKP